MNHINFDWRQKKFKEVLYRLLGLFILILFGIGMFQAPQKQEFSETPKDSFVLDQLVNEEEIILPVSWNNLGRQLVKEGVIDRQKLDNLYANNEDVQAFLSESSGKIKLTRKNAPIFLNFLWALGLANKNNILETGEMANPAYKLEQFASIGGWTLATGPAVEHYSKHHFLNLTDQQQAIVEDMSKNIYRPCCNNNTHFPDCNHGMAMLGLLELMASQGVSQDEMYKAALAVNAFWFPDNYLTIAQYLKDSGKKDVSPKTILGAQYSSSAGYQKIKSQVVPIQGNNKGGCGV